MSTLSCSRFPVCSGCRFIGTTYDEQLDTKLQAVRTLFERAQLPGFDSGSIPGITPSPRLSGYRNRAKLVPAAGATRLHYAGHGENGPRSDGPHRESTPGVAACGMSSAPLPEQGVRLGLYRAGTHDVVDIPGCPVHTPGINRAIEVARSVIDEFDVTLYDEATCQGDLRFLTVREGLATSELLLGFVTGLSDNPYWDKLAAQVLERCDGVVGVVQNVNPRPGNVIFGPTTRLLAGQRYIEEIVCGVTIQLGITSFFQVNTAVAELAYQAILARLALTPSDTLLDLYAGVGAIGLVAAGRAKRVLCLETSSEAVEFARAAGRLGGIANIEFLRASVERRLPSLLEELRSSPTGGRLMVVLNPPRGGVEPRVIEALTDTTGPHGGPCALPARIAYLSCSPVTLLRDLARLTGGGYGIRHVELFDMCPQTEHIETLAILEPKPTQLPKPLRRALRRHI